MGYGPFENDMLNKKLLGIEYSSCRGLYMLAKPLSITEGEAAPIPIVSFEKALVC